jgi:peptidoglycan hydrolase-like protein with peptidoglycan-binding domain
VRLRFRTVAALAGTVAVVGVAAAVAVGFGGGTGNSKASNLPPATAKVVRTTLTDTEKVQGTLGYGDPTALTARGGGAGGGGTVTWLPSPGSVIGQGKTVYSVDARPVVLIHGSLPLYRPLTSGVSGSDVLEFETALAALGYGGFTVDDDYTSGTADAVRSWQSDLGLTETGTVAVDQVVVAAADIRVEELKTSIGSPATGPILTWTGTTRTVSIDLDVAKQQLAKVGGPATVTLPDGRTVDGTVSQVGTVATAKSPAPGGGQSANSTDSTVKVTVDVKDQQALGSYDAAPVDITLVSDKRENVLAVPVGALVALTEGGYGVQVVDGTATRYLPVRTGLFADGKVEVSGDGLREGMTVGVPR